MKTVLLLFSALVLRKNADNLTGIIILVNIALIVLTMSAFIDLCSNIGHQCFDFSGWMSRLMSQGCPSSW